MMARHDRAFYLPEDLREQMAGLARRWFCLLPLGGSDGKSPILRNWATSRPTLCQVLGPMYGAGSQAYGIRLDGLAVIDCDVDDPELIEELEARFGVCPVHVKTPRGLHLYYRAGPSRPSLKAEGLPVDVKSGPSAYVVGPGSIRPDGGEYVARKGDLGSCDLPVLICREEPEARVPKGVRNEALCRTAIGIVEDVGSREELAARLTSLRDASFEDPSSTLDGEVQKVAKWAWEKRCENSVYAGRQSALKIDRRVMDTLRPYANYSDALSLYLDLSDFHGHRPGATFALRYDAMRMAGLTHLSRERFRAARRMLEDAGLLEVAENHQAGVRSRRYRLRRPATELSEKLVRLRSGENRGEGF